MRRLLFSLTAVAALAGSRTALATDIMVTMGGADGPMCGPVARPCQSIQAAIARAVDGDRILVGPGNFNGFWVFDAAPPNITIASANPTGVGRANVTGPPPLSMITPSSTVPRIWLHGTVGWTLRDLDVSCEPAAANCGGVVLSNARNATLRTMTFTGTEGGTFVTGNSTTVLIEQCGYLNNRSAAIGAGPPSTTFTLPTTITDLQVRRSVVAAVARPGSNESAVGIALTRTADSRIENTLISGVDGYGIVLGDPNHSAMDVVRTRVAHNTIIAQGPILAGVAPLAMLSAQNVTVTQNVFSRAMVGAVYVVTASTRDGGANNVFVRNAFGSNVDRAVAFAAIIENGTPTPTFQSLAQWQMRPMSDQMPVLETAPLIELTDPTTYGHLLPGSPAINAGLPLSPPVPLDFDGETRDSQPDLGFDEFIPPVVADAGTDATATPDGIAPGDVTAAPDGASADGTSPLDAGTTPDVINVHGGACAVAVPGGAPARAPALFVVAGLAACLGLRRPRRRLTPPRRAP